MLGETRILVLSQIYLIHISNRPVIKYIMVLSFKRSKILERCQAKNLKDSEKETGMEKKKLVMLVLSVALILGLTAVAGCVRSETDTAGLETQTQIIKNITPKEASTLIENNHDNLNFVIIDVRTPEEFAEERIDGAINLDYYAGTFEDELNKLDKNRTYVVYCRSGVRSGGTLDLMKELGFKEVYNILGGIIAWKADVLPTIK